MIVGVPREVKLQEYRVGLTPAGAARLVEAGHKVLVASGAGVASGLPDEAYSRRGAQIVELNEDVFDLADLIVKFHSPTETEVPQLRAGQVLFSSCHLATAPALATALMERGVTAIAFETVATLDGALPIVRPMSEIAGKMAVQIGASCLSKEAGGKGLLLGGVTGVRCGTVTILGGGTVGQNAARVAEGMGARVYVLDQDLRRLAHLDEVFGGRINTVFADAATIEELVLEADLLIGAVLITGKRAPRLVDEPLVRRMDAGSVIVDVSVDQGGCVETIHPTTHGNPTYLLHRVVHYGVVNMPGAVARTSTLALTNVTIGYVSELAGRGLADAARANPAIAAGINVHRGRLTHPAVAESLAVPYTPLDSVL